MFKKNLIILSLLVITFVTLANQFGITPQILAKVEKVYGKAAKERVLGWTEIIPQAKNKSEQEKLRIVNNYFNQVDFINDDIHWGEADYWATPIELLATNGGDCEDFSIAKYFTLVELGVPVEKMRLTYVKALELNQAHMVLTYYKTPNAVPLVLDNLMNTIKPATQRKDLLPVYSFNGDGLWLNKERGRGQLVGPPDRISLWQDLNERILSGKIGKTSD